MSMDYDTIGSFNEYEAGLDISHSKLHFKSRFKSGDHELIMNSSSIVGRYFNYILGKTYSYTLTDKEYVRYKFQPKLFCHEKYGTTELWSLLLKINNWVSISEFNAQTIKIFDTDILDILNEIFTEQDDDITKNELTIQDGYESSISKTQKNTTIQTVSLSNGYKRQTSSTSSSNYVTTTMLNEALSSKVSSSDLATVATSGSFEDLEDAPIMVTSITASSTNNECPTASAVYSTICSITENVTNRVILPTATNCGQSGQVLVSDGTGGTQWATIESGDDPTEDIEPITPEELDDLLV